MAEVQRSAPTLDENDQLPVRFLPPGYIRNVDLATLDADGDVVDKFGNKVSGGGISQEDLEAALVDVRLTLANLPAGSPPWPVKVWDGVQLLRSTYTDRTDIGIIWEMPEAPSFAPGYAIAGLDGWRRRLWVSS